MLFRLILSLLCITSCLGESATKDQIKLTSVPTNLKQNNIFHNSSIFITIGGLVKNNPLMFGNRIVGGEETAIEEYPYQISLEYGSSHRCGGSILDEETILTAAHCTSGLDMGFVIKIYNFYMQSCFQIIVFVFLRPSR